MFINISLHFETKKNFNKVQNNIILKKLNKVIICLV